MLFFDARLSSDGTMSCATCHRPGQWFTDGRARGKGREIVTRNTPTVVDSAWSRWFGWGGANDSLWSQTTQAITAPLEMAGSAIKVTAVLRSDSHYQCLAERAFKVDLQDIQAEETMVLVAKAIAAYQETLVSGATAFDRYRDALARDDARAASQYPDDARAGLALFQGKGNCALCHLGPRFTNDEFADAAIPHFTKDGVDRGRYAGIPTLKTNPFNRLGKFSDNRTSTRANFTRHVQHLPRNFGEFRVPSLRNVARTAPYMHDGSIPTLAAVIEHYSELNEDRLHANGVTILRRLDLSPVEQRQLVAFLESLTADHEPPGIALSYPIVPCVKPAEDRP